MRKIGSLLFVVCLLLLMIGNSLAQSKQVEASRKFDEFSGVNCEDLEARLDNFAIKLLEDSKMKGYIVVYSGRHISVSEARARAKRAKDYLTKVRGIDAGRIMIIDGGRRDELTVELYLAPPRATSLPSDL